MTTMAAPAAIRPVAGATCFPTKAVWVLALRAGKEITPFILHDRLSASGARFDQSFSEQLTKSDISFAIFASPNIMLFASESCVLLYITTKANCFFTHRTREESCMVGHYVFTAEHNIERTVALTAFSEQICDFLIINPKLICYHQCMLTWAS